MIRAFLPVVLIVMAGGGCSQPRDSSTAPAVSTEGGDGSSHQAADAEPPDLAFHMNRSFWDAIQARDALIDGDLERAKRRADFLATEDFEALPEDWKPWIAAMQKEAGDVTVAADTPDAAQHVSALAITCGNCHARGRGGPGQTDLPPDGADSWKDEDLSDRMLRHQWAADELWFAMVTPSDLQWQRGARALEQTFFTAPGDGQGEEVDEYTRAALEEIRAMGKTALKAGSPEARADVYGKLLSRCASCHHNVARREEQSRVEPPQIPNGEQPAPGILTGGQPSKAHLAQARAAGFTTVINLRPAGEQPFDEKAEVEALGLRYLSIPVAGAGDVTVHKARALAAALKANAGEKTLLHCGSGNRAGALLSMKAFHIDGASAEDALRFGKAAGLKGLESDVAAKLKK